MRKLSRTKKDFFENKGWSSHYFFDLAQKAIPALEMNGFHFQYGRHVMYVGRGDKYIKIYPHYKGRDRKHLTFVSQTGKELKTIEQGITLEEVIGFFATYFENE